jgi:hypothetical protein
MIRDRTTVGREKHCNKKERERQAQKLRNYVLEYVTKNELNMICSGFAVKDEVCVQWELYRPRDAGPWAAVF